MADSDYGDLANPNKVGGSDARDARILHELERIHAKAVRLADERDRLRKVLQECNARHCECACHMSDPV